MKRFALILVMLFAAASAFAAPQKKVVVVLATGFDEVEAASPIDILRRAGFSVTVAGLDGIDVQGSENLIYKADMRFGDVNIMDYDAIVIPGGLPGAENLARSEAVLAAVRKAAESGKVVAAICASPALVLAKAGVLEGHRATCYPGFERNFSGKVTYVKERTVTDGNLITANGPGSSMLFGIAIVDRMAGHDAAADLEKGLLIER
jgi:4-methyl-5(b-hydroxyethyl)-thiazole monophosphate biosynthesis